MLFINFYDDEREIRYTDSYFNNNYQDEWMEDVKKMNAMSPKMKLQKGPQISIKTRI